MTFWITSENKIESLNFSVIITLQLIYKRNVRNFSLISRTFVTILNHNFLVIGSIKNIYN